ncbi:protein of unknown function (plasmid) [Citrobacter freundii]|nr:protein of unknown function [Citrobacter freundii]
MADRHSITQGIQQSQWNTVGLKFSPERLRLALGTSSCVLFNSQRLNFSRTRRNFRTWLVVERVLVCG